MAGRAGIPTGVQIVLERAGRVLRMGRAGTGFFDGMWSLPGGHVEEGESLRMAACREVTEELGRKVEPEALQVFGVVLRRSDTNRIDFFLRALGWDGEPQIAEPDKCDALSWCEPQALPELTVGYVKSALAETQSPWLLELGW